jgi:oligopeptide transporter 2
MIPSFSDFFMFFSHVSFSLQWAEFILFSCLLLMVCLIFSIMGYYYVPVNSEDIHEPADKQITQIQGNMINLETKSTKL